jgi:hypothetical protein
LTPDPFKSHHHFQNTSQASSSYSSYVSFQDGASSSAATVATTTTTTTFGIGPKNTIASSLLLLQHQPYQRQSSPLTPSAAKDPPSSPTALTSAALRESPKSTEKRGSIKDMQQFLAQMNLGQVWQWIFCIAVINFDLDIGQDLEFVYPPIEFTEQEEKHL